MSENLKKNLNYSELLKSQTNAEESQSNTQSSEQLITREPIEHTPFHIIGNEERGYFLAMGKFRISEPLSTIDEVKAALINERWNILVRVAAIIADTAILMDKENAVKLDNSKSE